ncbi:hypothetical protein GCM10027043_22490 [Ferruginibacter profundus]
MISNSDKVKEFIPGIYFSEWQNEFKQAKDTLEIKLLTPDGSETYQITRRVEIIFLNELKKRPPEYKMENWTGNYNRNTKTVFISNTGSTLSFDTNKKVLLWGTTRYIKLSH